MADLQAKIEKLKQLKTKELIEAIEKAEQDYERALRQESSFKDQMSGFLCGASNDCQAVKAKLAELAAQAPADEKGKPMPAAKVEAWLITQRTTNRDLIELIEQQRSTAFTLENNRISSEMARRRLERMRAVLELKTAQINFLAAR